MEVTEGSFTIHPNILENLVFFLEVSIGGPPFRNKTTKEQKQLGAASVLPKALVPSPFFFSPFQTISIVLWVCSYSDAVLRPCRSNLQKKKKKKKESITTMVGGLFLLVQESGSV